MPTRKLAILLVLLILPLVWLRWRGGPEQARERPPAAPAAAAQAAPPAPAAPEPEPPAAEPPESSAPEPEPPAPEPPAPPAELPPQPPTGDGERLALALTSMLPGEPPEAYQGEGFSVRSTTSGIRVCRSEVVPWDYRWLRIGPELGGAFTASLVLEGWEPGLPSAGVCAARDGRATLARIPAASSSDRHMRLEVRRAAPGEPIQLRLLGRDEPDSSAPWGEVLLPAGEPVHLVVLWGSSGCFDIAGMQLNDEAAGRRIEMLPR